MSNLQLLAYSGIHQSLMSNMGSRTAEDSWSIDRNYSEVALSWQLGCCIEHGCSHTSKISYVIEDMITITVIFLSCLILNSCITIELERSDKAKRFLDFCFIFWLRMHKLMLCVPEQSSGFCHHVGRKVLRYKCLTLLRIYSLYW